MSSYVALLRAINVGGTGKLPMADLKNICTAAGFKRIETYIASGNVVFKSSRIAGQVQSELEARLLAYAGKPVGVLVRSAAEMQAILNANPFPDKESKHTYVFFLHQKPGRDAIERTRGQVNEELHLGRREIYVHYPTGMGRSKLQIPAAKHGTARNMNTVATLVAMSRRSQPLAQFN